MKMPGRALAGRGFTLVEALGACAMAAVLAGIALPVYQGQQLKAHRVDAVAALMRLQDAQERAREGHGSYESDLATLGVPAQSPAGLYTLRVERAGPERYRAVALAAGRQSADSRCPQLTLEVAAGFAQTGPSAECWNR
ncbi:MAG: type IV pilin protein [Rubrivivax sp.]